MFLLFGRQCQDQLPLIDLGLKTLKIVTMIPRISLVLYVGRVIAQPCWQPTLKAQSKYLQWHLNKTFIISVQPILLTFTDRQTQLIHFCPLVCSNFVKQSYLCGILSLGCSNAIFAGCCSGLSLMLWLSLDDIIFTAHCTHWKWLFYGRVEPPSMRRASCIIDDRGTELSLTCRKFIVWWN